MEKVSIIIPCYNAGEYIKQCLESIINQTYTDLEIICINDGSTDETPKILEEFALLDQRVIVINQENKGISAARNSGLRLVTGEFVMFVDSDDWLDLHCISILFDHYDDEDIVMFSYMREFDDGCLEKNLPCEGVYPALYLQRRLIGPLNDEKSTLESIDCFAPVWGKLYKKNILSIDLFFRDLDEIGTWEDGLFNLEVLENCQNVLIINKPFYHYRKSNNQSYTTLYKNALQQKWIIKFKLIENYLKEQNKDSTCFVALNNRVCLTFLNLCLNELNSKCSFLGLNKKVKEFLNNSLYKQAFKDFDLSFLPWYWKVFYYFVKIRFYFGISAMAFTVYFIINRKNK